MAAERKGAGCMQMTQEEGVNASFWIKFDRLHSMYITVQYLENVALVDLSVRNIFGNPPGKPFDVRRLVSLT